jgi:O-acetyl-ADP-ribose deacetylase (regulator of RNase III)
MKISIIKADIAKVRVDAIVNSANKSLMAGSGVCGVIHRAAGVELEKECKELAKSYPKGLPVGHSVLTKAYKLPAKYVIHTVGPRYGIDDVNLLKDCYINSMRIADKNKCESIAFPAISTGIYGVPVGISTEIVREVLSSLPSFKNLKEIILVLCETKDFEKYKKEISQ